MRLLLRAVCVLAPALLLFATAGSASAGGPGPAPGSPPGLAPARGLDGTAVDRLVREYRDRTGVPGVVVTVTRGDRTVTAAGYGHTADGMPIGPDTPVPVASLSKAVTAVAVLQLVREGRIALDRPVTGQLPEFTTADPRSSRITVRQLLNQTSGITDHRDLAVAQPSDLRGAVAALRDIRLGADPGAVYHYHNTNYAIAARLVEVVAGRPFAQQVRDRVFAPLGMTRTSTVATSDDMPDRARGYVRAYGLAVPVDEPRVFTQGGYGVVTTAVDLGRWLAFQNGVTGSSVLPAGDLVLMRTPVPDYGMGWWPDGDGVSHTGQLFTHNAMATLLPSSGTGIAVVTNTGTGSGDDAANLASGLADLARGGDGATGDPFTLVADPVLAVLTLLAAALGVRGTVRAGRWARRPRPLWRTVAALVAVTAPPGLLVAVAALTTQGRTTPWQTVLVWPALVVALVVTVPAAAAVLAARLRALGRRPDGSTSTSGDTRSAPHARM